MLKKQWLLWLPYYDHKVQKMEKKTCKNLYNFEELSPEGKEIF